MKKIIFALLVSVLCGTSFFIWQKKKKPLISVVMPIYNRPDLAPRSIESILNQTFKDFEFIIVDDGSKEETKKVLKEYAKKDSRIRVIQNPKNRGIAYSRQRGLEEAKGTYVAVMDSDDWSVPDRLEKSLSFMRDHPEVTAMTAQIRGLPKEDTKDFIQNYTVSNPQKYTIHHLPGFYEVELMFYNVFPNASSFFKRDFAEKKHIRYDYGLISAEDYDFWVQFVFNGGNMASISDVLLYVGHSDDKVKNYYGAMGKNSINIHKKAFSLFFTPTKEELKFEYDASEKCNILSKIKKANLKEPYLPQIYLDNRYNAFCPSDLSKAYYLVHKPNKWTGYLEEKEDDIWVRLSTRDTGKLVKIDEKTIEVHWTRYPKERFVKDENDHWNYILHGKKIKLKHINWVADFIIEDNNSGCRLDVKDECAKIKKVSKDAIWVDWTNEAWANEEFKKTSEGDFKFVRELPKNTKF